MSYFITDQCTGCTACFILCPTQAIRGERKVIHVIDVNLCIDCGACGRICSYTAVLDQHAQPCVHTRRSAWLKPRINPDLCTACGLCIQACPVSCLEFDRPHKKDKTLYPFLASAQDCLACGFCVDICPVDAVFLEPPMNP